MTTSDVDATTASGGPYMTEARHRAGPVLDPETQVTVARRLFAHIDNKTTDSADEILRFDASVYTDPRILAREREMIFDTTPVIVAHSSEIARPNDFLRVSLPGADVLVVRQRDGGVKAMLNSCRHRGTALTLEMSGNKKLFMCPYHAWCYGPDGSLDFVTDAATVGPIDKKSFGLIQVPCEERHGLVWVIPNPDAAISVAGSLGPDLDAMMAGYQLGGYYCYRMDAYERAVNWKMLFDAFLDNYHIQYLHAKSVAPFFYNNTMFVQDLGRNSRIVSTRKRIDEIRHSDPAQARLDKYVTLGHLVWPNAQLLRQPTHFELFTFVPDGHDPAKARMEIRLLAPEPAQSPDQINRWEKNWEILLQTIVDEDLANCESLQKAMTNSHLKPLLLGKNELLNQIFHRELIEALGGDSEGGIAHLYSRNW
jgi:phenylpropionate dioxygenase-like ring-hydroxylating dioxygenase large terminal subunit